MNAPVAKNLNPPKLSVSIHFVFLLLWIIAGAICYLGMGHENFFIFPMVIFTWLLSGIGWFCAFRWKWKAIWLAPLLTALACSELTALYDWHDGQLARQALDKFILTTTMRVASPEFVVGNEKFSDGTLNREIWDQMQRNVTSDYVIEYRDNFFGSHEWIVRFTNGSAYFLSFKQTRLGHWSISIEPSE